MQRYSGLPTSLSAKKAACQGTHENLPAARRRDVPDEWPELLGGLVDVISAARDGALVAGAVRCLSLFVDDLGEKQVHQVRPHPFATLAASHVSWRLSRRPPQRSVQRPH